MNKVINVQKLLDCSTNFNAIYNIATNLLDKIYPQSSIINTNVTTHKFIDYNNIKLDGAKQNIGLISFLTNSHPSNNPFNSNIKPRINIGIIDSSILYNVNNTDISVNGLCNSYLTKITKRPETFTDISINTDAPMFYLLDCSTYNKPTASFVLFKPKIINSSTFLDYNGRLDVSTKYKHIIKIDTNADNNYIYSYDVSGNLIESDYITNKISNNKNWFEEISQYNYTITTRGNDSSTGQYVNNFSNSSTQYHFNAAQNFKNNIYIDLLSYDIDPSVSRHINIVYPGAIYKDDTDYFYNYKCDPSTFTNNEIGYHKIFVKTSSVEQRIYISYKESINDDWSIPLYEDIDSNNPPALNPLKYININSSDASLYMISYPGAKLDLTCDYTVAKVDKYNSQGKYLSTDIVNLV